jgi:hypothetical protein
MTLELVAVLVVWAVQLHFVQEIGVAVNQNVCITTLQKMLAVSAAAARGLMP